MIFIAVILLVIGFSLIFPNIIIACNTKEREGNDYSAEEIQVLEDLFGIELSDSDEIVSLYASFLRDSSAVLRVKPAGSITDFVRDEAYERSADSESYFDSKGKIVSGDISYLKKNGGIFPDEITFWREDGYTYAYCRISLSAERSEKIQQLF